MTPDTWTIIGTGIALAGVVLAGTWRVGSRLDRVEDHLTKRLDGLDKANADLRERMAKLEGLLEGLREAISGGRTAA